MTVVSFSSFGGRKFIDKGLLWLCIDMISKLTFDKLFGLKLKNVAT